MDKNIDNILVPREQAMLANEQIPAQPAKEALEQAQEPKLVAAESDEIAPIAPPVEAIAPDVEETPTENLPVETKSVDSPIDEYGNPLEKPKMYSEDEVQRMIRERLARGRHSEQPTQQQVQQATDNFKADPNNPADWEVQLEAFIDKTVEKRQKKLNEEQWRLEEQAKQAEFESKFTIGMAKYQDFQQTVAGKPINDKMMMAARALDNPAAFIYGAAKLHPQELNRIAQIKDPYIVAAEIGRLHEKMVKAKNAVTKAAAPLQAPKGDVPTRKANFGSIESRIDQHAKSKRK